MALKSDHLVVVREKGVRDDLEVSGLGDLMSGSFVKRSFVSHEFTVLLNFLGRCVNHK